MKDSLKNIFENFEPTPPQRSWDKIATNLEAHKKGLVIAKIKKTAIITTSIIILSGIILYSTLSKKDASQQVETKAIENTIDVLSKEPITNTINETGIIASAKNKIVSISKKGGNIPKGNNSLPPYFDNQNEREKSNEPTGIQAYIEKAIQAIEERRQERINGIEYASTNEQSNASNTGFDRSKYVSPLDDDFLKYYYFDNQNATTPSKSKDENDEKEKVIGSNYEDKNFKSKVVQTDLIAKGFGIERGFYVGAGFGGHYSSLSGGRTTINDYFKNNFTEKNFSMGTSLEFVVGYDINKNMGIASEIKLTQISQSYTTPYFDLGLVKEENIKLSYLRVPILFKYRMIRLMKHNHKPMAINILAGPSISSLVAVSRTLDGEKGSFKHTINQREIGITAAIETDLFLSPNFFMTIGYRAEVGWGTNQSPLDGRIRSFNTGIYARFNLRQPQNIQKTSSYYK